MILKNLQVCTDALDDLAPRKKKCTRGNYSKQRNYCVKLLRKTKIDYYALLNKKDVADEKNFWKTIKPLLSEKIKSSEKIYLTEA